MEGHSTPSVTLWPTWFHCLILFLPRAVHIHKSPFTTINWCWYFPLPTSPFKTSSTYNILVICLPKHHSPVLHWQQVTCHLDECKVPLESPELWAVVQQMDLTSVLFPSGLQPKPAFDSTTAIRSATLCPCQSAHCSVHNAREPSSAQLCGRARADSRAWQSGHSFRARNSSSFYWRDGGESQST